jgi:type IV secretory pathway VirJ component
MKNQTANTIKIIGTSAIALILITSTAAITALFLVSDNNGVGRLLSGDAAALSTVNAFAQQQNKTDTTSSSGNNTNTTITAASSYNEMLNPRQTEYPAHLGFNDLHIEAIRHIDPNATYSAANQTQDDIFNLIVHHHCKVYEDMTAACLLFPTGMNDQDKPYGIEYVIPADLYNTLPEEEKKYWHYHLTELPKVKATTPDMTAEEAAKVKPVLDETYGKVVYFWQLGDSLPIGQPKAIIIEDIVEQAEQQQQNATGQ